MYLLYHGISHHDISHPKFHNPNISMYFFIGICALALVKITLTKPYCLSRDRIIEALEKQVLRNPGAICRGSKCRDAKVMEPF